MTDEPNKPKEESERDPEGEPKGEPEGESVEKFETFTQADLDKKWLDLRERPRPLKR